MQGVQISHQQMRLIADLSHNLDDRLHFCSAALLVLFVPSCFQMRRIENKGSSLPIYLDLKECLSENRKAMIVRTKHREAAEADHMVVIDVGGLTNCQVHSQLLCKYLCVGKAPGLQQ